MPQQNIVRLVSLLNLALGISLFSACPAPLPYEACQTDQDCPESYICQVEQHICAPGSHFDAGQVADVNTLDVSHTEDASGDDARIEDAGHSDSALRDLALIDSASADHEIQDLHGQDIIAPDSASTEAGVLDANQAAAVEISSDKDRLFPGESLRFTANINMPVQSDATTLTWSIAGSVPDGLSLQTIAETQQAVLTVNRELYTRGDEDVPVQISLQVFDGVGNTTEAQKSITILDERGPFVVPSDLQAQPDMQAWEGQGYTETGSRHGFCGAARHACKSIEDAQANLSAFRNDHGNTDPVIKVWSGSYNYDATIHLNSELKLFCGYNSWETEDPTDNAAVINIASNLGLSITEHSATIKNCRISIFPPDSGSPEPYCAAIAASHINLYLDTVHSAGSQDMSLCQESYGLDFQGDYGQSQRLTVMNSNINGGRAIESSIGVKAVSTQAIIEHNSISGGMANMVVGLFMAVGNSTAGAPRSYVKYNSNISGGQGTGLVEEEQGAVGMIVFSGDPWIKHNAHISGGSANSVAGIWLQENAEGSTIQENNIFGNTSDSGNTINKSYAIYAQARADSVQNHYTGGSAAECIGGIIAVDPSATQQHFAFSSNNDSFTGGQCPSSTGLVISGSVDFDMNEGQIFGVGYGQDNQIATGLSFFGPVNASVSTSVIRADAEGLAQSSFGIVANGADLNGQASGHLDLTNSTIDGHGQVASFGLMAASLSALHLEANSILAGGANNSNPDVFANNSLVVSNGLDTQIIDNEILVDLTDSNAQGSGVYLTRCPAARVEVNNIEVLNNFPVPEQTGKAALGFSMDLGCDGSQIFRNQIHTDEMSTWSQGVYLHQLSSPDDSPSHFYSNNVSAGKSANAIGLQLMGNAAEKLIVMGNNIMVSGEMGLARALLISLDQEQSHDLYQIIQVGAVVGNILGIMNDDNGASSRSYNIFEDSICSPYQAVQATVVDGNGGEYNDLWPAGDVLLRKSANYTQDNCESEKLSINALADVSTYETCLSVDPEWDSDGFHLLSMISPLNSAFANSANWLNENMADVQVDIDGQPRPADMQNNWSIGCDEFGFIAATATQSHN